MGVCGMRDLSRSSSFRRLLSPSIDRIHAVERFPPRDRTMIASGGANLSRHDAAENFTSRWKIGQCKIDKKATTAVREVFREKLSER